LIAFKEFNFINYKPASNFLFYLFVFYFVFMHLELKDEIEAIEDEIYHLYKYIFKIKMTKAI